MKTIHVHLALWVILLVGGFLLGFVPEYRKNRELAAQLESPLKTIDALKLQLQLGELRDHVGLMLLGTIATKLRFGERPCEHVLQQAE